MTFQSKQITDNAGDESFFPILKKPLLIVCSLFLSKISCVGFFSSVIWAFLSFVLPIVLLDDGDRTNVTQYINTISIFRAVRFVSVAQTQTKFAQQKVFTELNKLKNEIGVNAVRGGQNSQLISQSVHFSSASLPLRRCS
jgi:hypothetical protein